MKLFNYCLIGLATVISPAVLSSEINSGDTAWILTATALVLFMTLPGLALFYGGLVRTQNVLSVLMQCFAICCIVSVVWVVYGYSLAFTGSGSIIGGTDAFFLSNLTRDSASGTLPESLFIVFQMGMKPKFLSSHLSHEAVQKACPGKEFGFHGHLE